MRGYPIQLTQLEGASVLIVGAGPVAASKVEPLFQAGAKIHVVAKAIGAEMSGHLLSLHRLERRSVRPGDLDGKVLVVVATNDGETNEMVVRAARRRRILVNTVDQPELCDFFVPATLRRGPVTVSVSTDGGSPLLAGRLRRLLEAMIPGELAGIAELFVHLRRVGFRGLRSVKTLLWALTDAKLGKLVEQGRTREATERLASRVRVGPATVDEGSVAIVGAGPGGREHLTIRALEQIQSAELIFHDRLVSAEVLEEAMPETVLVDVGCRAGRPGRSRSASILQMIEAAEAGVRVVRLHGGDPSVFARTAEEITAFRRAGVEFEITPGVSSVNACAAAAKLPLTARGRARGISVRTGHRTTGYTDGTVAPEEETIVVLMALGALEQVTSAMLKEGRPHDAPAAVVSCAGTDHQRVVQGTLATIAMSARAAELVSPATLIVGVDASMAAAAASSSFDTIFGRGNDAPR